MRNVVSGPIHDQSTAATIGAGKKANDRRPQYTPTARARTCGSNPVVIRAFRAGSQISRRPLRTKTRTSPNMTGRPAAAAAFGNSTSVMGNSANRRNVTPINGFGDVDRSTHLATGTYVAKAVVAIIAISV